MSRRTILHGAVFGLAGLLLAGCGAVKPEERFENLNRIQKETTGSDLVWERDEESRREIEERTARLLDDGLSRREAVELALLRNRDLQAALEDVGIAEAMRVQAGLFTNPSLDAFIGFPIANGDTGGAIAVMLSDLWIIPARVAVAEKNAEAATQRIGEMAIATATTSAAAWDAAIYSRAELAIEQDVLDVQSRTLARIRFRYDYGLENDIEIRNAMAERALQAIRVAEAKETVLTTRARLARALALSEARLGEASLEDDLAIAPSDELAADSAIRLALDRRLDIAVAKLRVRRAENTLVLEKRLIFPAVSVGAGYEGDFNKDNSKGPTVGIEVPLFDQNLAQIARAEFEQRQAEKELEAIELRATEEVRTALAELERWHTEVRILEEKMQPTAARRLAWARKYANRMQLDQLKPLMAEAMQLEVAQAHLGALRQARLAALHLEQALYGGSTH